ncbi:hypothetical protein KP79_PYT01989 [Mizuhopecten yessoensis]|uniref:YqaJ viral recombinase domain-containing protein n=1 Tax=Mizuhopecten yessoensis TaxID=6573 RepID=A0A210Q2L8_MIZYE|nr:hypothetical protein KP79_PYT01989 [Mizuhopecten yessoensis]
MAGADWKKSNLCNVISAISTQLYDVSNCIENIMRLIDKLCYDCATLYGSQKHFALDRTIQFSKQENHRHLNDIRTDEWFNIRATATVTGSTLNAALGLDTLKSQQEHYDCVKSGTKRKEPSPQVMEKIVYGTQNEIHAVATAVSKVMPVFFPNLIFSEEWCIKTESNGVCIVISPDGSFVEEETETTTMAVEIKSPFPAQPGTYKPPIYHKVPTYYVPQILSEMYALNVESLFFLCYSQESTSAMHTHFDADLWCPTSKKIKADCAFERED